MPTKSQIGEIVKVGLVAPSGRNVQNGIIVVIENKKIRDELSRLNANIAGFKDDFDPFYNAPVVLLVLMKKCPIAYGIKDTLAYYRVREGSLSNNKMKLIRYNVTVYKQILKYNTVRAWATFLCVFLPNYLLKKCMTKLVNR